MLLPVFAGSAHSQELQSLFNGKDLSGWAGKPEFWSVKDGVIFGQTTEDKPTKGNTFLVWQGGESGDFVFKAKVRFSGNNSGVQYRSERVGDVIVLNTDLTDPNQRVTIDRNTIDQLVVSKTSPVPAWLFNRMTRAEILDLTAYLISGGDSEHELFRP